MNSLFGILDFDHARNTSLYISTLNKYCSKYVNLHITRTNNFNFDNSAFFFNPNTKVLCGIIGYIDNIDDVKNKYNISATDDVEIVEEIYTAKQLDFIYDLKGLFTIFIFDEKIVKGYIFQDEFGSNLPLYYTKINDKFFFSTSLKRILKNINSTREFDLQAIYDFLLFGFLLSSNIIPNKRTLLKNIYKLTPQHYLVIDVESNTIETKTLSWQRKIVPFNIARDTLLATMQNSITILFDNLKNPKISQTLTSGFDTNYMLYTFNQLRKTSEIPIKAFTVRGEQKSEIETIQLILKNYENIIHKPIRVYNDIMDSFPDMVWVLEGYNFKKPLPGTYALARGLSAEGCKAVFMGSGADQQLDFYKANYFPTKAEKSFLLHSLASLYYVHSNKLPLKTLKRLKLYSFLNKKASENVGYSLMTDYILKGTEVLFNNFEMQGVYPFMNTDICTLGWSLGMKNFGKRLYKQLVRETLPHEITQHISKIPGGIDADFLFSPLLAPVMKKIATSELMHCLFTHKLLSDILHEPDVYSYFIMLLFYLLVFEELFMTGKYDSQFENTHVNIPLEHFLTF